ncbi:MAG: hypothetical protein GY927_20615 [bacterium]|nr:hypothetical protein [bacterium]
MSESAKIGKKLGAVERKIHEGERLLGEISRTRTWAFVFFVIGFLMIIFSPGYFNPISIVGIVLLIGSTWRINRAGKGRKEVEFGLGEYRARRAELQATLVAKKMDEGRN